MRKAVGRGTRLGKIAESYMQRGELVPDDLILELIEETLDEVDTGFILDGFPRTLSQAEALDRLLEVRKTPLTGVIFLDVPDEEIIRRLGARRVCPKCGAVYNMLYKPPKHNETCDKCGTHLVKRKDDEPETVKNRLVVYRQDTAPLIDYYKKKGLLVEIDGRGAPAEVTKAIEEALNSILSN